MGVKEKALTRFTIWRLKEYSRLPSTPPAFPDDSIPSPEQYSTNPPSSSPSLVLPFLKHFSAWPLLLSTEFTRLPHFCAGSFFPSASAGFIGLPQGPVLESLFCFYISSGDVIYFLTVLYKLGTSMRSVHNTHVLYITFTCLHPLCLPWTLHLAVDTVHWLSHKQLKCNLPKNKLCISLLYKGLFLLIPPLNK